MAVNTFGNDNKHNVTGSSQLPGGNALNPDLNLSTVLGNGNKVDVKGSTDVTTVTGNDNKVSVKGNTNLTSVFGNGNKVSPPKYKNGAGVNGNGNITTIVGSNSKAARATPT